MRILSILAGLLLLASMAVAAPAAPAALPAPGTAAAPGAPQAPAASACPAAALPSLLPLPQELAFTCGACSDQGCVGLPEFSTCGSGFRCLAEGSCSSGKIRCQCLII